MEESDQVTHMTSLDDEIEGEDMLDIFQPDANYIENEEKYRQIRSEILGEDEDGDEDEEEEEEAEAEGEAEKDGEWIDLYIWPLSFFLSPSMYLSPSLIHSLRQPLFTPQKNFVLSFLSLSLFFLLNHHALTS